MTTTSAPATSSATAVPRLRVVVSRTRTSRSGVNFSASAAHTDTTELGATTRNGGGSGRAWRAWAKSARVWTVLPRPMSSARIPPRSCSHRNASQRRPSSW